MSKFTKRLLCVLAAVIAVAALSLIVFAEQGQQVQGPECYEHGDVNTDNSVDTRDAVYILYHIMFQNYPGYEDRYPVNQDWDYEQDGQNDTKDAIYLLYHIMFEGYENYRDRYPLKGTVHDYYDPSWTWIDETGTAKVTFKCGCGESKDYTTEDGVTVTAGQKVDATCVTAGSQVYTASVTVDGEEYTNTYTKTLPAGEGHKMVGTQDCENGSHCENCDYSVAALGHSWKLESSVKATCTEDAYELYRCSGCQKTDKKVLEGTAGHSMEYDKNVAEGCKVTRWYKCSVSGCEHTAAGTGTDDVYYEHSYTAALTTEATCVSKGVKTYSCNKCSDSYTVELDRNDSHDWDEGTTADSVTTHSCKRSGCQATKTTVEAKNTAVEKKDLVNNELQLQENASMKLDEQTVKGLEEGKKVTVSVAVVKPEEAGLTAEQQAQVGDAKVYDFSMKYEGGAAVSQFAGEITISLPYKLDDGEDVDSINVWYIDDSGNPTAVKATYSNGFVTFTTTHFSYYTVTRLTPEERCALYGHMEVRKSKAVTCTEDGYEATLCSRCGDEISYTLKARSGHDFTKTVTQAATCENAGIFQEVCGNCGAKVQGVIPATGHAMEPSADKSVKNTCEQAGKEVSVCTNDGCSHEREVVKPQLSHDYKADEKVEPDCENKGIQTETCQLCGHVNTVEEKLPLGHSFEAKNATWSWASNHLSATVTLTCSHDKAHTKVLTAVVSKEVAGGTCETGASVTYTATASHNKETFTDTYTERQAAPGHTAGTQWQSNANQHYHICDVCQDPVDQAAHTWNEGTVITEPTCAEEGKTVYACLVCGYEKDKTVPATKQHNYVNGICSVCGRDENDCRHYQTIETEVDVSGYGLCEGAMVWKHRCECGEKVTYDYDLNCNINYDVEPEEETVNGVTTYTYNYTCADCGLNLISVDGYEDLTDECARQHYEEVTAIKDGEEIFNTRWNYMKQMHPPKILVETVDLAAMGLCGESKIEMYRCGCEANLLEPRMYYDCSWTNVESTGNVDKYICTKCGVERHWSYNSVESENSCESVTEYSGSFYMDGELIYSYTETNLYYEHYYEVTDYELLGKTCEDGVILQRQCKECGETEEFFRTYCMEAIFETVDLPNTCIGEIRTYRCPCGAAQGFEYVGEDYCSWGEPVTNADGSTSVTCQDCGLVETSKATETTGENCNVTNVSVYTYADAQGNLIATVSRCRTWIDHEYERSDVVFRGKDCEGGVSYRNTCKKCGYSYVSSYVGHQSFLLEYLDLSDSGLCQTGVSVYGCLCGKAASFSWTYPNCQWEAVAGDGDEDFQMMIYRCNTCGGIYEEMTTYEDTDDPCQRNMFRTLTFWKDQDAVLAETPIGSISYTRVSYNHDMRASFTLNNAELGCEGGYKVTETCQRCGAIEQYNYGTGAGHNRFMVDSQKLSNGQLCCDVYQYVYSCPCGKETSKEVSYQNGACNWQWAENGYRCAVCGVTRNEEYSRQKVEGTTCTMLASWSYTFQKDGQDLFTAVQSWTNYDHRSVYTFQMNGDTCQDGYRAIGTCLDCDTVSNEYWSWCESRPVERTTVCNDENMCDLVEWVHYQCPCGKYNGWYAEDDCSWSWTGLNQNGEDTWICTECGAKRARTAEEERIDNTCKYLRTENYTFTVGEQIYSTEKTYETVQHSTIAVLTCLGDSCEDGYQVRWKCRYCDYVGEGGTANGHGTYIVEYYDLADYGMCGGYVEHSSCACGQESRWGWNLNYCNGSPTGNTDPDTGDMEYYCSECGSFYSWGQDGEVDRETCTFNGQFYFKLRNEEQTLLNLRGDSRNIEHDTYVSQVVLDDPNGTCEDGVNVTWQCRYCEENWTNHEYGHYTRLVWSVDTACGSASIQECACGYTFEVNASCDGMQGRHDTDTDENGVEHRYYERECADCGLYILQDTTSEKLEGCQAQWNYSYLIRYGETEKTVSYTQVSESHNYGDRTYTLLPGSETCKDGILASRTCADCGDVETWTESGHATFLIRTEDLTQIGACSGKINIYSCACGEECRWDWIENCAYHVKSWEETDANGTVHNYRQFKCGDCGLNIVADDYYEQTELACKQISHSDLTITCGDQQLTLETKGISWSHKYDYEVTLRNPDGSCEDGVTITRQCRYCDYNDTQYYTHHYQMETMRIDTACGGYAYFSQCACGESKNTSAYCDDWSGKEWYETDENGVEHLYYECACKDCGLYYLRDTVTTKLPGCQEQADYRYVIRYGDREETMEFTETYVSHAYGPEICALLPGSETCDDGILVSQTCADCGLVESWQFDDHRYYIDQTVDMSELGACEGSISVKRCACGQYVTETKESVCTNYVKEWDELDASGLNHRYIQYKCTECGLEKMIDCYYEQTDDPCWRIYHRVFTFTCGDQQVTLRMQKPESNHEYVRKYALVDPECTCEDGLLVTETCKNCDYSNSWTSYSHATYSVESIDLKDYGSVCGGTLDHYSCACGEKEYWQLNEENLCDLDTDYVESWIENALNEYQEQDYLDSAHSYFYRYRCAVTDPVSCGLNIRYAKYWLKEDGCKAVQYEQWLLGYDEETGTYQKKIEYVTNTKTWHDYEEIQVDELDEAANTRTVGQRYVCKDCGSIATRLTTYLGNTGTTLRWERKYENTLDDGEYKFYQEVDTYEDVTGEGDYELVLDRTERIHANGVEFWYQYAYTYDIANCKRIYIYSTSNGQNDPTETEYHYHHTNHTVDVYATCSQPGYHHCWETCDTCGEDFDDHYTDREPGHNWYWSSSKQTYVCSDCGLQGENGADGDIILEDLTETYGNGTDYVIGYYNPENIDVVLNLSVILDNAEGDNQISLDFDDFTYVNDDYQGVTFNKEAADAAAAAAVPADYEGTYAIRISFVPTGASTTLDYAITFDSVQAQ